MELYKHNQDACDNVLTAFRDNDRAAIVHATGTGKSYCIAAVADNFDKVLVIAPNNFVLNETKKVCKDGVEFRTYASIMYESEPRQYDLIVLDEFHRSGAGKWGEGVQRLLSANQQAKILGTSATHIRYLDGNRNMADEIFEGRVVSRISLKDAIEKGILPSPTYVSSLYSMEDVKRDYTQRINESKLSQETKDEYLRQLKGIAQSWEQSHGVPKIIRKYFDKDMQRIIVFCSNVSKAKRVREMLSQWFTDAGYDKLRFYNIDYQEKRLEKEMADFQEPVEEGGLKVAITVNMLNEGVHIPRVDGIIMLRSTISRIIIEQQIGRCLTADNKHRTPVVLDLVNNLDLIAYRLPVFTKGDEEQNTKGDKEQNTREGTSDDNAFPFTVIDECRDIRVFFEQLDVETECRHYWTKEELQEIALKYTRRMDFFKNDFNAYHVAQTRGILKEITSHMPKRKIWTKEECAKIAKQYTTKIEFELKSRSISVIARKRGWYEEICSHMKPLKNSYSIESVKALVNQYESWIEFKEKEKRTYKYAAKHGWIKQLRELTNK